MKLYVMRHGTALEREHWSEDDDSQRPLTEEGRVELEEAARGIQALDLGVERIVTSPFVRAYDTAQIVGAALGLAVEEDDVLAPGATLAGLCGTLTRHADEAAVLVVGHEPDLSGIIGALIAGKGGATIALKKGAVCCVDVPDRSLRRAAELGKKLDGKGALVWLVTAPQLRRIAGMGAAMPAAAMPAAAIPAVEEPHSDMLPEQNDEEETPHAGQTVHSEHTLSVEGNDQDE